MKEVDDSILKEFIEMGKNKNKEAGEQMTPDRSLRVFNETIFNEVSKFKD